jgi:hypothetical protein
MTSSDKTTDRLHFNWPYALVLCVAILSFSGCMVGMEFADHQCVKVQR